MRIRVKIRLAIYARYSTNHQRATSIEDQIRRCVELANRLGFIIEVTLIFSDAALSGTAKHRDRRSGYNEMLAAWDAGCFDILITDDFSRLTRDGVEQALLIKKLEDNQRVRLVTCNGIDTEIPNWQLQLGVLGAVGQQSIRDTKHLVVRGMIGQLERGFMIATPALGYALLREFDSLGNRRGTYWQIDETARNIVVDIFQQRAAGRSMHQIARDLNARQLPIQRKAKSTTGGFWRASRIKCLLRNPIYRGEFLWNNSTTVRAKAKKSGRKLEIQSFPRPLLRIVSDELWYRCNENVISRSGYGGGKHPFSGLVNCGCCGSILVLSSQSRCRSLYCANCSTAKAVAGPTQLTPRQTSTIAAAGVESLLRTALRDFLTPAFVTLFREKLHAQLTSDHRHGLEKLQQELFEHKRNQERISRMLSSADGDDPVLMQRYEECREKTRTTNRRLDAMISLSAPVDQAVIEAQMRADPWKLLDSIFDEDIAPERLRALLVRLFPKIIFNGKPNGRYSSHFSIEFNMGEALALASDTSSVISESTTRHYRLTYVPTRKGAAPYWTVQIVTVTEPKDGIGAETRKVTDSAEPLADQQEASACCLA